MNYFLKGPVLCIFVLNVFTISFGTSSNDTTTQSPSTKTKASFTSTSAANGISTTFVSKVESSTKSKSLTTKAILNHSTTARTTSAPKIKCEERNKSCSDCTEDYKCFWCGPSSSCMEYPASHIVPRNCKDNKWYWKQCFAPGYVLIIVVPSLAGLILITCGCCIYCMCCRTRSKNYDKEDGKFRRKRQEIKQRNEERRAQRKQRTDAIRKKYGLLQNNDDDAVDGENQIV